MRPVMRPQARTQRPAFHAAHPARLTGIAASDHQLRLMPFQKYDEHVIRAVVGRQCQLLAVKLLFTFPNFLPFQHITSLLAVFGQVQAAFPATASVQRTDNPAAYGVIPCQIQRVVCFNRGIGCARDVVQGITDTSVGIEIDRVHRHINPIRPALRARRIAFKHISQFTVAVVPHGSAVGSRQSGGKAFKEKDGSKKQQSACKKRGQ